MTTFEKELRKRGITMYRFVKLLGKNPYHVGNSIKNRVVGNVPIEMGELTRWCFIVGHYSKRPLKVEDLNYKIDKVLLT